MKFLSIYRTLRFILNHPLNRNQKGKAMTRFFRWQLGSRLIPGSVLVSFVNNSRLIVIPGMTGATGNIYTGLHEFEDMAFTLHLLRENSRFIDIGANIGSYTILASSVVGAKSIAIEPVPSTFEHLCDNINVNGVFAKVQCLNLGVSSNSGTLKFTSTLDTVNHVVVNEETTNNTIDVPVKSLDQIADGFRPTLIKIDVEGFETEVISGAKNIFSEDSLLAIIMELNGAGERYGFNESALHRQITDFGFNPYSYSPFSRNLYRLDGKNTKSGNTLYIRNINLVAERLQTAPTFWVHGQQV